MTPCRSVRINQSIGETDFFDASRMPQNSRCVYADCSSVATAQFKIQTVMLRGALFSTERRRQCETGHMNLLQTGPRESDDDHHHISVMELGHLLTRSGLTYPEVSSKAYHDSFCQLGSSISLPCVIYFEAFYLHVVSSFSCIPVICPKLVLFLTPSQFVHFFCNLSKCILLFFSCISSLLLLFFWRPLL